MEIFIIVIITFLNGILSMTETAFVSARKARLQQMADDGDENARITLAMTADPNRLLSAIQIGITLIGVLAGAFGGITIAEGLAAHIEKIPALAFYSEAIGLTIVVIFTTYLSLVVGELVPKSLALRDPERVAAAFVPRLRFFATLTGPLIRLLSLSTALVLRLLGIKPSDEPPISAQEIQVLIRQGVQAGVFDESEHEMVSGVLGLSNQRVSALMTPRTEITWIDLDDAPEISLHKIVASPHSRFPVGKGSLDNIQGIIRAKELLDRSLNGQPVDLSACVKETLFVPETATAAHALELLKQSGRHIALVFGEYGGVEGLITLNNLVEEIIGDIGTPTAVQRADGSWLLDGLLTIEAVKEVIVVKVLPGEGDGHYQTLGGFIMAHLGHVPNAADYFDWNGWRFEVMDMDGRRVDKVLVSQQSGDS
ncbi:MAG: hemolysin family protein [Chloroflexota bacterium]